MVGIGLRTVAFAILLITVALQSAHSQDRNRDRGGNQPGQFDFHVLALSWSPSFCQDTEERGRNGGE